MHALYLALTTLFASAVFGQGNPGLPSCAWSCVQGYGGCGQFDYKCICSNKPYIAHLSCCVFKACDKADQEATLKFADALCAGQQVTNLPQTATCSSGAAGSSSTSSGSGTGTGTTAAATNGSSSSNSATTTGATTTTANGAQASSSSAAASSSSPAAAVMNKMDTLGMGMVVAGIVAAL